MNSRRREMTNAHESMDPHEQLVVTEQITSANKGSSRLTRAEYESKQLDGEKMAFQLVQTRLGKGKAHMTVKDSYGTWMTPVTLTVSVTTPHHEISRTSSRGQHEGKGYDDLSTDVSSVDPAGRKLYHSQDSLLGTAKCRGAHTGTRRCDASSSRAGKYGPQMATSSAQTEISQKESSISETLTSVADGRDCHPNITSEHIERRHILQRVANPSRKPLLSCSQKSVVACRLGEPVLKKRVRFKDVCEESNSPVPSSFEYGPCTLMEIGDLRLVQSQNQVSQIAGPCRRIGMANSRPNYESPANSWNLHDNIRRDPFPSDPHRIPIEKLATRSIQLAGRQSKIRFSEVIQTFDPRVYESLQENPDGFGEVEEFTDDITLQSRRSSYVYPPTDDPNWPPPSPPPSRYPPSPRRRSMKLDKTIMQRFDDLPAYRSPPSRPSSYYSSPPPSYPPSPGRRSLQSDQLFIQLPPPSPPYRHPLSDPMRRSILRNQSLAQDLPLRLGRSKSVTFDQGPHRMPSQPGRSKSVASDEAPVQYITFPQRPPISPYEMGDQFWDASYDQGPVDQFNEDTERRLGRSPSQVALKCEVYDERGSPLLLCRSNSGTLDQYGIRPPTLEIPISPYEMAEQFSDFSNDREPVEFNQETLRLGRTQSFDEVPERAEGPLRRERSYSFDEFPRDRSFMRPPPLEIPNSPNEIDEGFSDVYYDRGSVDFSQEPYGQEEPVRRSSFPDYYTSERESMIEESSPNRADSDKAKLDFRQELYQQTQVIEETIFDLLSKTNATSKELAALERQERLSGHLKLKESGKDTIQDKGKTRSSSRRIADMSRARRLSGSSFSKDMKEVNQTFDFNTNDPRRASSAATCEFCLNEGNSARKFFIEKKTVTEADIYELIENFQVEMMKLMERTDALFASQEEEQSYNDEVQRINGGIPAAAAEGGRE